MSLRSFEYRNVLLSDCRYQNVSGSSKYWFHILTGPMFIARPRNWTANLEQSRRLFENSQRRVPKHGQTPTILCDSMSLIWDQIFWPSDHWFPEQKWHLYEWQQCNWTVCTKWWIYRFKALKKKHCKRQKKLKNTKTLSCTITKQPSKLGLVHTSHFCCVELNSTDSD